MGSRELALADIAARETSLYLRDRAKIHLEAAIGSLLCSYSVAEVAKMLRDNAEQLDQFG